MVLPDGVEQIHDRTVQRIDAVVEVAPVAAVRPGMAGTVGLFLGQRPARQVVQVIDIQKIIVILQIEPCEEAQGKRVSDAAQVYGPADQPVELIIGIIPAGTVGPGVGGTPTPLLGEGPGRIRGPVAAS